MADSAAARLRLIRTPRVGPVTYRALVGRFGSAEAALDALPELATRGGGAPPQLALPDIASREIEAVAALGARHLFIGDDAYPPLLAQLDNAPPVLIVRGDLGLLAATTLAVVGARNASAAALRLAREITIELGRAGVRIVSGLARGVDTAAHQGALATGTIAVVAGGIDVVFPPENAVLQERIAREGLLIAEQPPGVEPRARHFPYRNRIIAGVAQGVLVVEAAPRSGSLITARLAADLGREVMAMPGSPLDPRAQGCNGLIRDGAALVQSAADILEELDPIDPRMVRAPLPDLPSAAAMTGLDRRALSRGAGPAADPASNEAARRDIARLLAPVPVSVDELVRQAGRSPQQVQLVLLELELAGRVERHAGGRVSTPEPNGN